MKVVIFAGGLGTRISEETDIRPKPMVEIGGKPILWHIMKIYSSYGFNEFIICIGYKGYVIKEYFMNYFLHNADFTVDLENNHIEFHKSNSEKFKITLVETGLETKTAGRLKAVQKYIGDEDFMLTYGDGVSDVNINDLVSYHKSHGKTITMTSVQPEGRYGSLVVNDNHKVLSFLEKPKGDGAWINAGYFVCQPEVFDYIPDGDNIIFEREPLEGLASAGQLYTFKHDGFWKPMDTQRDKSQLEELIEKKKAPWISW